MRNIGIIWGIIGVILTIGSILRFIVFEFYNIFIRGLSKRTHKGLVNNTIALVKIMDEDHGIFAFGSSVAIMLHTIIMFGIEEYSFTGILVLVAFGGAIFLGLVFKYIYRDRGGKIKFYHRMITYIYIAFLMIHLTLV